MFVERNEEQLMSVEEVCQQLFTSPGTVYKLLRSGEIKGLYIPTDVIHLHGKTEPPSR